MEKGFYHEERGYWQTMGEPPESVMEGYPEGTIEVPLKPTGVSEWTDGEWVEPAPDLEALKADALIAARQTALNVRKSITGTASVERAMGWVLKAQFAKIWADHEQDPNDATAPLATVAQQGFGFEAGFTGEDATAIRDLSIEKAGAFFLANQIVEGMERLTENDIEAVTSLSKLDAKISELRGLEAQAMTQLATLAEGDA